MSVGDFIFDHIDGTIEQSWDTSDLGPDATEEDLDAFLLYYLERLATILPNVEVRVQRQIGTTQLYTSEDDAVAEILDWLYKDCFEHVDAWLPADKSGA